MDMRDMESKIQDSKNEIRKRRKQESDELRNKFLNKKMYLLYALGILLISSFLKVSIAIPANVKVYLDEENHQFISPSCLNFAIEEDDNISVATYREAIEGEFFPDSPCTDETVHPTQSVLKYYIMNKLLGVADDPLSRWTENGDWKW